MKKVLFLCVAVVLLAACQQEAEESVFVISELMANNQTGLMAADGELYDWIEIRNNSAEPASLDGYSLTKDSGEVEWEFPDTLLNPGECVLVFATKKELSGQLSCGFKLSSDGDTVCLVTPRGDIASEVGYKKLKADKVLKLTKNGKYKKTYHQTPGFSNDKAGREQYYAALEQQRRDPLKIWEYVSVAPLRWVELRNTGTTPIDLSAYALSKKLDSKKKVALPQVQLAPGEIYLFEDKEKQLGGDRLVLSKKGKFVDGLHANGIYRGISIGRKEQGKGFYFFAEPTKNAANSTKACREVCDKPKMDKKPGAYTDEKLVLRLKNKDARVHYTLDGTAPTMSSPVFPDSLVLTKNTILRTFAEDSTRVRSDISTSTYILGTEHKLPIVCVMVNEDDLYNETHGIYVEGPGASPEFPHNGANYWKRWEKKAHVEFYDEGDGFSYDCGLYIFGGFSRALAKKSFRIKLHGYYGQSHVDYDLYKTGKKEHVKSFVLRSGSQDWTGVMVRDEFFTSLMKGGSPNLFVQAYRPVVLYLNAQYFGIYYIREKLNADYVANHLGVDKSTVTMLFSQKLVDVGSNKEYCELVDYACSHDTRDPEVYKYLKDRVDFESLIDFKIGEFFFSNTDAGNIRYFKSSDKRCDGRWHWVFYDLDATFATFKPLSFYIQGNSLRADVHSPGPYNALICQLLKNPEFRALFLERWAYHRKNTLSEQNQLKVYDDLINTIKPEMPRNCKRWPQMSYQQWEKNVAHFREKIINRPAVLDTMFSNGIQLTPAEKQKYGL